MHDDSVISQYPAMTVNAEGNFIEIRVRRCQTYSPNSCDAQAKNELSHQGN